MQGAFYLTVLVHVSLDLPTGWAGMILHIRSSMTFYAEVKESRAQKLSVIDNLTPQILICSIHWVGNLNHGKVRPRNADNYLTNLSLSGMNVILHCLSPLRTRADLRIGIIDEPWDRALIQGWHAPITPIGLCNKLRTVFIWNPIIFINVRSWCNVMMRKIAGRLYVGDVTGRWWQGRSGTNWPQDEEIVPHYFSRTLEAGGVTFELPFIEAFWIELIKP